MCSFGIDLLDRDGGFESGYSAGKRELHCESFKWLAVFGRLFKSFHSFFAARSGGGAIAQLAHDGRFE